MRIKQLMKGAVAFVDPKKTVKEVALLLVASKRDHVIVFSNQKPIGIVTFTDIIDHIAKYGRESDPINSIMSSPVVTMDGNHTIDEAMKIVDTQRLRKFPVSINGQIEGTITNREIILYKDQHIKRHRRIQNSVLTIFLLFEIFVLYLFREYFGVF